MPTMIAKHHEKLIVYFFNFFLCYLNNKKERYLTNLESKNVIGKERI